MSKGVKNLLSDEPYITTDNSCYIAVYVKV